MDGWKKIKLEDALNYRQPTNHIVENTDYDDSYETPVLTPGQSFLLGYTDESSGIYKNVPTIIFDDFTTAFKYVDFPFKVKSSAMKILELKSKENDIKFLYYLMLTLKFDATQHKRYWISKYSKQVVMVPSLAEQKQIAEILDVADSLRQKDQQLIEYYTALSQSLFLDMFGDPVANPMGWKLNRLADLTTNLDGKRVPVKSADRSKMQGIYPYYGASGIIDYVDDYLFDNSNLLVAEDGANLLSRSTPVAFIASGKYWVNNHAHVLGLNDKATLNFIRFSLENRSLAPYVTGSAQPKLNQTNLNKIPIPTPPIKLQGKFEIELELIDKQKQQAQASLDKSEDLFNSLLQRAFKGELTSRKAA